MGFCKLDVVEMNDCLPAERVAHDLTETTSSLGGTGGGMLSRRGEGMSSENLDTGSSGPELDSRFMAAVVV